MDVEEPSALPIAVAEEARQKLRYTRVCIACLGLCAIGRWVHSGNTFTALSDFIPCSVGACIFREKCDLPAIDLDLVTTSCLFPFMMLAGLNSCFDALTLFMACGSCFQSRIFAESTICSGCFFTFSATVFQALGSILSWQVYQSCASGAHAYGRIAEMQDLARAAELEEHAPENTAGGSSDAIFVTAAGRGVRQSHSPSNAGVDHGRSFVPFSGQAQQLA